MHLPLIFLCLQLASCNLNEGIEKPLVYALMLLAFAISFREGRKSRWLQKWFAAISACHCRKGQEKVAHVLIVHSPAMDYRLLCLQIDRLTDEYERNREYLGQMDPAYVDEMSRAVFKKDYYYKTLCARSL